MLPISEFQQRRQALLKAMLPNSVALLPAAKEVTRSNDTEFAFRQDSDFIYLAGFPEPDAWLLLSNMADKPQTLLFCRAKNKQAEIWQGRRIGPDAAVDAYGVEQALPLSELKEALPKLLSGHEQLYFAFGHYAHADDRVLTTLETLREGSRQGMSAPSAVMELRELVHEMRLIKSGSEISLMSKAANIACDAHIRAMQYCRPGVYEYQLEAEIHHEFAMQGARHPAYGTIVGGGDNACILHYTENSDELKDGELVLIDAGGELQGYAADITRTFPVNGKFTADQAALYQLVLDAQLAAFKWIKPGNTLKQAMDCAVEVITTGLIQLGILQGDVAENIEQKTYRQYFMHGLGHWLGLDVHDVGDYKIGDTERPLQSGMILTVEPGIYIDADAEVDAKWQGMGIRIEDNLLVTEYGYLNLTEKAPKYIDDIEALMAEHSDGNL